MKKLFLLGMFILTTLPFFAQSSAVIKFSELSHNFGTVAEEAGSITYSFAFTNEGNEPLVVSRVSASCGCTTPDWSKEPVAPGKTGYIKVTYNTAGRPGPFTKTITVFSNAKEGNLLLNIQGTVTPKAAAK